MSATGRGAERAKDDFYETPEWLIKPFLYELAIQAPKMILEPAAGNGAIVRCLREHWPDAQVDAIEIDAERAPNSGALAENYFALPPEPVYDLVITNPPFLLAQEYVEWSRLWVKPGGTIAMLLRINFLGAQKRGLWMQSNTPSLYVSPRRPSFGKNKKGKKGTDATEYAWMTWCDEVTAPTVSILETWQ